MSIFKKKSNEEAEVVMAVPSASFEQRLDNIKSMFLTAYEKAVKLNEEINKEIEEMQSRLQELNTVNVNTIKFIDNIKGFI